MNLINLVLTVCTVLSPTTCEERRLVLSWSGSLAQCARGARALDTPGGDGVAPARKPQHEFQLGTLGVFARGFVGEGLIERDPIQLPLDLLVKDADPDVADALSGHRSRKTVKMKSVILRKNCQETRKATLV